MARYKGEITNKQEVVYNNLLQEGTFSPAIDIDANTSFITISALDHDRIVLFDEDENELAIVPAFDAGSSIHSFLMLPISGTKIKLKMIEKTNQNPATIRIYVTRYYVG